MLPGYAAAGQCKLATCVSREASQPLPRFLVSDFLPDQLVLQVAWLDWLKKLPRSADMTAEIIQVIVSPTISSRNIKVPAPGNSEFFIHGFPLNQSEHQQQSEPCC